VSWCVVGNYEGDESQTRYRLAEELAGFVWSRPVVRPRRGAAAHRSSRRRRTSTASRTPAVGAISIHVYGADIERLGSSINKTFDHLPIHELAGTTGRPWRTA